METLNRMISKLPAIFSDVDLDNEVKTKYPDLYSDIVLKRIDRYSNANKEWMKEFPKQPLPTKTSLELRIASLESPETEINSKGREMLNQYKSDLQQGLYCDGINEHALYRGSYEDRKLAFVWPTTEELELRAQEESALLAKVNK